MRLNLLVEEDGADINVEVKEYIHSQVRHIPGALTKINYELISVDERPESMQFSDQGGRDFGRI